MSELLHESIQGYNLPFTILLGMVLIYWVIALIGLADFEMLDGLVDTDTDIELDLDVDSEGAAESSGGGSFFQGVLKVVGASDAPLIFVISLFFLFIWGGNLFANIYFNPSRSASVSSFLLVPVLIGAFLLTRVMIRPLKPLMKMIKTDEKPAQIIGASGRVRSSKIDQEFGEIEVDTSDKSLILRARLSEGIEPLKKGVSILVVAKEENESETYIVRPLT